MTEQEKRSQAAKKAWNTRRKNMAAKKEQAEQDLMSQALSIHSYEEPDGPNPEDCEFHIEFSYIKRVAQTDLRKKKIRVGDSYVVNFDCPGCGHYHTNIALWGWTALNCQGCGATLKIPTKRPLRFNNQFYRTTQGFWSEVLLWLTFNRPELKIISRTGAMRYCHAKGLNLEDYSIACMLSPRLTVSMYCESLIR